MSRRSVAIAVCITTCAWLAGAAAAQQPRMTNAQVTATTGGGGLAQTFRSLVASQDDIAWIAYAVPVKDGDRRMCCWSNANGTYVSGTITAGDAPCCGSCRIEPAAAGGQRPVSQIPAAAPAPQGPVKLEGSGRMLVFFRVVERQVERVRTFAEDCELDAGGRRVLWLNDVRPAESVALLETLVTAENERRSRVTNAAIGAISMHADPSAGPAIERLARSHAAPGVRGEALFWLAQMAGDKAIGTITAAIDKDPDTEVKRRAVFALSQLPASEGVPLLIDVARRNANPAVRKQAFFWLGQTRDPRAIEFFAEILK